MALMRGAAPVRQIIADYLTDTLPGTLATARTQWGLAVDRLPDPALVSEVELYALDRFPCIAVSVESANGFSKVTVSRYEAPTEYLPRYSVRVFTWVKTPTAVTGQEFAETIRLRDDYAAVVRATLLASPALGHPDLCMWNESTLVEAYSDVTAAKGDRFVAGVSHSFEIRVDETLAYTMIGTADTITVDADMIGEQP